MTVFDELKADLIHARAALQGGAVSDMPFAFNDFEWLVLALHLESKKRGIIIKNFTDAVQDIFLSMDTYLHNTVLPARDLSAMRDFACEVIATMDVLEKVCDICKKREAILRN